MTKRLKGLLFDKDGTLIDFTKTWLSPMQDAACLVANHAKKPELRTKLLQAGGYLSATNSWAFDSIIAYETSQDLLDRWAELTSIELITHLKPDISLIVKKALQNPMPTIKNIRSLFDQLNSDYVLGVASMDDEVNVKITLKRLEIMPLLQFYCGSDTGYGTKPDPQMVQAFCQQTSLISEQIAVIGDGQHDLKMAKTAGSIAIGVLSGASTYAQLQPYADHIIKDIGQLPKLLANLS